MGDNTQVKEDREEDLKETLRFPSPNNKNIIFFTTLLTDRRTKSTQSFLEKTEQMLLRLQEVKSVDVPA